MYSQLKRFGAWLLTVVMLMSLSATPFASASDLSSNAAITLAFGTIEKASIKLQGTDTEVWKVPVTASAASATFDVRSMTLYVSFDNSVLTLVRATKGTIKDTKTQKENDEGELEDVFHQLALRNDADALNDSSDGCFRAIFTDLSENELNHEATSGDPVMTLYFTVQAGQEQKTPSPISLSSSGKYDSKKHEINFNIPGDDRPGTYTVNTGEKATMSPWNPVSGSWKVTFNTGDSGVTVNPIENVPHNTAISAPTPDPQWDGHTFGGWYKELECVNAWKFAGDNAEDKVTADTVLYAKWDVPGPWKVTFNTGDSGATVNPIENVPHNTAIAAPTPDPQWEDHRFDGWYKESECVNPWKFEDDKVTADTVLYAKWKDSDEVTVTFAPGTGGGQQYTETHSKKQPFTFPSKPDSFTPPEGYTFDGWTLSDGSFHEVGSTIDLTSDTTLTPNYVGGCYVATAVYGSYDCPEVWTLRRFRDHVLSKTWYGRLFIRLYYAVSPTAVRLFGETEWFQNFWRGKLDTMVSDLQAQGFESTPYQDMNW